ncbi:chloride channel protein [Acidicapsa acidisoli]|uniref:chloride channel protein n=1 Tax=Acidicapsa acidisoli TaxID=1615681 RepID=UPI0021DF89D2|nr:chloride channel protein [Acidicapsa acidisoli]
MTIAVLSRERRLGGTIPKRLMNCFPTSLSKLAWSVVIGAISGLACVGVRLGFRLLQWIFMQHSGLLPEAAAGLTPMRRLLTPMLGAACATTVIWAVRRWSKTGHAEDYIEAVRGEHGHIPFASTLWRTVSSAFSVATGAAIGREGSMIQFAAAASSWLGKRTPVKSVTLAQQVAYGAAAAVAAAYQAPIAGVFFAMEIVLGNWAWTEAPQLALASTAGWLVSRAILGGSTLFAVHAALPLSWQTALWAVPVALAMGVTSPLYQALLRSLRFARNLPLALVWSGFFVGIFSLLRPEVWGNGDVALSHMLTGEPILSGIAVILILRILATTFCVGTGAVGGVFTPTLFTGAAIGLAAGQIFHQSHTALFAIVGLSALLAATTHAPVMAALMAVELTGQWHLLPLLLILNLAAFRLALAISPHSLYAVNTTNPSQRDGHPSSQAHASNLIVSS